MVSTEREEGRGGGVVVGGGGDVLAKGQLQQQTQEHKTAGKPLLHLTVKLHSLVPTAA